MIYIGLDHGLKGAIAALDESGKILTYTKMPTTDGTVASARIYDWLQNINYFTGAHYNMSNTVIYGERLHALFGSSASATFSFAKSIGKALGAVECVGIPYYEVRARDWQEEIFTLCEAPEMGEVKKNGRYKRDTKAMASFCADHLWPELDTNHDGIIDALLIAEFARRTHKQASQVCEKDT